MSTETYRPETPTARLGSPRELAETARRNMARVRFAGRHPIVAFLVLPIPLLILLCVGYTAALIGLLSGLRGYVGQPWAGEAASILAHGIAYVPPLLMVLWIVRSGVRNRAQARWWLIGSVLIAVTAWLMKVGFRMPTTPGTGLLQLGIGFPPSWSQWPQLAVPLAAALLCGLAVLRTSRRSGQADLTAAVR